MQEEEAIIQDDLMISRYGLPSILMRVLLAVGLSALLVAYCYAAFFNFPGQTYPFILGAVAMLAWRVGGVTAGATLALTALGIDIWVLDGDGLAIAKPEQAAGLAVLLCVGTALIWTIRLAVKERDSLRARVALLDAQAAGRQGMLDELVHRIRNDLGALSSVASLYGRNDTNPGAGLKAMAERIAVLGRLYQRLHVSEGSSASVDMSVFLEEVVEDLRSTHLGMRPISMEAAIDPVTLPLRTASVVGLVLNESVANALKYAFPDDQEGVIHAELHEETDGTMRLEIRDDGVGPDGEAPKGTGMGTRLMRAMAAQIGGRYSLERTDGQTVARLLFPVR